jgi:Siphovirus Gp157
MTLQIEQNINTLTLGQLSLEAAKLWDELEEVSSDDEGHVETILQKLFETQGAFERKIDAIAYVADQLKLDIEIWQRRLEAITELHTEVINRKQKQLKSFKAYLLYLHIHGILNERNPGVEREISFQNSPPRVVLKVEPENPEFPEEFRDTRVEYHPLTKQILEAYKQGRDVSAIAEIESGKHIRFKVISTKQKRQKG